MNTSKLGITVRDFSRNLSYYVENIEKGPIAITKHGKTVAILKSITASKKKGCLLDLAYFKHTHIQNNDNDKPENIAVELRRKSWTRANK